MSSIRTFIINIYVLCNIFLTPFCDNFFAIYLTTSLYYAVELIMINIYFQNKYGSVVLIP